jgi:hypothetical protein
MRLHHPLNFPTALETFWKSMPLVKFPAFRRFNHCSELKHDRKARRSGEVFRSALAFLLPSALLGAEPSFNADVRPILSENCFSCHGPDTASNKADLRLDRPEDAIRAHPKSGLRAIVPGDPSASEAWRRILSKDADEMMPPPESHLVLKEADKDVIRRWIQAGARYEKHWAFTELPKSVPLPSVQDDAWPSDPLDRFVLVRLERENIKPSPPADPLRWLRRACLDLTGLPPSPELIARFRKNHAQSPDEARSAVVDELLSSPSFGEHFAVGWLDAARYADSYGYQSDQLNGQWPYRDWVVRAFNDNMPYDRFVTWQLAGDLLPDATRDQKLATAFNRLHRLTNEGGSISEEWLAENAADRVHTFGTTFLALTLECSRCHDHKYDPLPTRDYYQFTAFFNSIAENGLYDNPVKMPSPTLPLPTQEQEKRLVAARHAVTEAETAHRKVMEAAGERFGAWSASRRIPDHSQDLEASYDFDGISGDGIPNLAPNGVGKGKTGGLSTEPRGEGRALVFDGDHGASFPDNLKIDRWTPFSVGLSLRDEKRAESPVVILQKSFGTDVGYNGFDLMLDSGYLEARLYRVWPGNGIGIRSKEAIPANEWRHVTVTYDGSSSAAGMRVFINGNPAETEVLRDHMFKSALVNTFGNGNLTLGERFRDRGFAGGMIDDLMIYRRALTPLEIRTLGGNQPIESGSAGLMDYFLSAVDPACRESASRLSAAREALVKIEDGIQEIPVMEELPVPRETHVLARGEYDAPKNESTRVGRGVPAVLPPLKPRGAVPDRLDLARWLTEPSHPLTARVFVNRLWTNFFGRGLVDTPENFGLQGSLPSHPQLLDWLARDFTDGGWNIKHICKRIVLSRTYSQDSATRGDLAERDPANVLLARGPAHRLSGEQVRDMALAASGLLDAASGGPPVSPYQPGGDLWRESNGMSPPYHQSVGKALHRRSLYSVWKRTAPLPNMLAFDAGTRETCMVSRGRTNTPLQALVMLNDVQFVEAARALAEQVHHDDISVEIGNAYLRVTGRPPRPEETKVLAGLHAAELARFRDDPAAAKGLISHGETKPRPDMPADHLAATTSVCLAILNLDAALWKR